jgi:hypothetical protein
MAGLAVHSLSATLAPAGCVAACMKYGDKMEPLGSLTISPRSPVDPVRTVGFMSQNRISVECGPYVQIYGRPTQRPSSRSSELQRTGDPRRRVNCLRSADNPMRSFKIESVEEHYDHRNLLRTSLTLRKGPGAGRDTESKMQAYATRAIPNTDQPAGSTGGLLIWQQLAEGTWERAERPMEGATAWQGSPSLVFLTMIGGLAGQSVNAGLALAEETVGDTAAAAVEAAGQAAGQSGSLPGWLQPAILATPLLL